VLNCLEIPVSVIAVRQQIASFHPFVPGVYHDKRRLLGMFVDIFFGYFEE
jgi:hypothetical protein